MSVLLDITTQQRGGCLSEPPVCPAEMTLSLDVLSDTAFITPRISSEVRSGAHSAGIARFIFEPGKWRGWAP